MKWRRRNIRSRLRVCECQPESHAQTQADWRRKWCFP